MKLFFPIFYITASLLCFGKVLLDYSRTENLEDLRAYIGKPMIQKEDDHILLIEVEQRLIMLKKSMISADVLTAIKNPINLMTFKYGKCPDGCNYDFVYSVSSEVNEYLTYDDVIFILWKKRIWYLVIGTLLGVFGIYKLLHIKNNKDLS